ncbi:MAG: hypothetical protein H8E46_03835 [FCB group bacterium]|nr:hypothetical protein [FCB group bacterium]
MGNAGLDVWLDFGDMDGDGESQRTDKKKSYQDVEFHIHLKMVIDE